jgi:GTP-binding protein
VERCAALLHVLDCATLEPNRDPITDLDKILHELNEYEVPEGQVPLTQRPQLIALNKIDVPDGRELADFVKPDLEARGYKVFEVSAASREGLKELNYALAQLVEDHRKEIAATVPVRQKVQLMHAKKREEKDFTVTQEVWGNEIVYRVLGSKPERWVAQTMFGNEEAVGYLADRLAKIGLEDELFRAGAIAGDTIVIGPGRGVIFDWEPTINAAAELIAGPRGTDARIDQRERRTTKERREQYEDMMDQRAALRDEFEKERKAGKWSVDREISKDD